MTDTPPLPEEGYDYWDDREAVRAINGLYANRIFVQPLSDGMLRINFGQVFDEEPSYHSAVVVSARDAAAFAELIFRYANAILTPIPTPAPAPAPAPEGQGGD